MIGKLVEGLYYLLLGVWVGLMVGFVLAAIAAFGVLPGYQPALGVEPYNDPAFADRAGQVLAGSVVNRLMSMITVLQWGIAVAVGLCLALQGLFAKRWGHGSAFRIANLARVLLIVAAVTMLAYGQWQLNPAMQSLRLDMYRLQHTPTQRQEAQRTFDRLHLQSERLGTATTASLALALLVSPWALRRPADQPPPTQTTHT